MGYRTSKCMGIMIGLGVVYDKDGWWGETKEIRDIENRGGGDNNILNDDRLYALKYKWSGRKAKKNKANVPSRVLVVDITTCTRPRWLCLSRVGRKVNLRESPQLSHRIDPPGLPLKTFFLSISLFVSFSSTRPVYRIYQTARIFSVVDIRPGFHRT